MSSPAVSQSREGFCTHLVNLFRSLCPSPQNARKSNSQHIKKPEPMYTKLSPSILERTIQIEERIKKYVEEILKNEKTIKQLQEINSKRKTKIPELQKVRAQLSSVLCDSEEKQKEALQQAEELLGLKRKPPAATIVETVDEDDLSLSELLETQELPRAQTAGRSFLLPFLPPGHSSARTAQTERGPPMPDRLRTALQGGSQTIFLRRRTPDGQ